MHIRKATRADCRTLAELAQAAGCSLASIEVFEQNQGALRLYERLGYRVVERRAVVPHPCHPYTGDLVLLTRAVA